MKTAVDVVGLFGPIAEQVVRQRGMTGDLLHRQMAIDSDRGKGGYAIAMNAIAAACRESNARSARDSRMTAAMQAHRRGSGGGPMTAFPRLTSDVSGSSAEPVSPSRVTDEQWREIVTLIEAYWPRAAEFNPEYLALLADLFAPHPHPNRIAVLRRWKFEFGHLFPQPPKLRLWLQSLRHEPERELRAARERAIAAERDRAAQQEHAARRDELIASLDDDELRRRADLVINEDARRVWLRGKDPRTSRTLKELIAAQVWREPEQ